MKKPVQCAICGKDIPPKTFYAVTDYDRRVCVNCLRAIFKVVEDEERRRKT